MIIRSKRIYTEDGAVDGYLVVEGHKVKEICDKSTNLTADIDATDEMVIPGIFDTHNHGTMGYALTAKGDSTPDEIRGYLKGLASQGVTNILPTPATTVMVKGEDGERVAKLTTEVIKAVADLAKEENDGAKIVGIHSEGPYLNRVGEKGIHVGFPEVNMDFVKKMVEDGQGLLRLVALAPEIPGIDEVIHYLVDNGVRVAYAHSDCDYKEALESFGKGITVITHTSNVMSGIHHRNMGGLGACLLNKDVWCEVICDGLHVSPEMLEIMFATKPYDKWMMISDNAPIAGAPVGRYDLSGRYQVTVDEDGFCLSDTGRLMGSTKPVLYGMGVLRNKLNIPMETVVRMASLHPCIVYGFDKEKGSLKVGKDADFAIISDEYKALYTYSEGRKVYDSEVDGDVFNPAFLDACKVS